MLSQSVRLQSYVKWSEGKKEMLKNLVKWTITWTQIREKSIKENNRKKQK